ncbi:Increased rDNA silencing protein [Neopestalotiopsis sp. 37M]|nr:Increased rDNA silencing protein [Neopestalotiopsis sp. 37M]
MHRPVTPNHPSRRLSSSSTVQDGQAYQTALKGASLAFQRTGPSSTSNNGNGAANPSRHDKGAVSRQTTGGSVQNGNFGRPVDNNAVSQRLTQTSTGQGQQNLQNNAGASMLKPPGRLNLANDPRATSFIAATLAASRSASPSPNHRPQVRPSNNNSAQPGATNIKQKKNSPASSVTSLDLTTDTTSIPPTNALISMFETNDGGHNSSLSGDPTKKKPKPRPVTPSRDMSSDNKPAAALRSPSPSRLRSDLASGRSDSAAASHANNKSDAPNQDPSILAKKKKKPPPLPSGNKPLQDQGDMAEDPVQPIPKGKQHASTPPRPASKTDTPILSPQPRRAASHKMVVQPPTPSEPQTEVTRKPPPPAVRRKPQSQTAQEIAQMVLSKPTAPKPVPQPTIMPSDRRSSQSSDDTFVSASSVQTSRPPSPRRGRSPTMTSEQPPTVPHQTRPRSSQSMAMDPTTKSKTPVPPPPRRSQQPTNMSLTNLTNATMAGILASSRTPLLGSPAPSPRPPSVPPRQKTPGMRQTLRKPRSDSSDEEQKWKARHKTKPLQSKKKHSHHEGARKRWREEITIRERRRYEGVWASNRGRLLTTPPTDANGTPPETSAPSPANGGNGDGDLVVNVIVRDIWSRSRLPPEELAEVWDLVDQTGRGALTRTEFVVGMWLIDQRLRGRKIPQKVMDSVWTSARGVSVKGPPKDKRKVKHH